MHLILYVLDALRADHLGCYGYPRKTSPNMDMLASNGALFRNCFTQSTWTRSAAASILTGTYPEAHGVRTREDTFDSLLPRLPEILQSKGFSTACFSSIGNVSSDFGFANGFDVFVDMFRERTVLERRDKTSARQEGLPDIDEGEIGLPRAEDLNERFYGWLSQNMERNTFSLLWSMEPHEPYSPPQASRHFSRLSSASPRGDASATSQHLARAREGDIARLTDLYDDEIRYNDQCIGDLVQFLNDAGVMDDVVLIITGDHGDAFFEHGIFGHGHCPYDELLRVPLIFHARGVVRRGVELAGMVELVDIFPTMLEVSGVSDSNSLRYCQGATLLKGLNKGNMVGKQATYSDTQLMNSGPRYLSVRTDKWKYIEIEAPDRTLGHYLRLLWHAVVRGIVWRVLSAPRTYLRKYVVPREGQLLFDLDQAPLEAQNVQKNFPGMKERLAGLLSEMRSGSAEIRASTRNHVEQLTAQESELLKSHLSDLGYL